MSIIQDAISMIRNAFLDPISGTMTSDGVMAGLAGCTAALAVVRVIFHRRRSS
jgi:hypothetical protein